MWWLEQLPAVLDQNAHSKRFRLKGRWLRSKGRRFRIKGRRFRIKSRPLKLCNRRSKCCARAMPRAILQVHGEYKLIYSIKFKHKHLSFKHTTLPHIRTALQMSLWSSKHTLPQIDSVMRAKQDELMKINQQLWLTQQNLQQPKKSMFSLECYYLHMEVYCKKRKGCWTGSPRRGADDT